MEKILIEYRWYRNRFLVLLRVNALLRNAKRLKKANKADRAKAFISEAKETIDAYFEER